jgi:16S rRNA (cytosine967-C5)-methyltransferase
LAYTRAKPFAIVDHAVATTAALGKPAAKGLTNAILRNYLRRREALHGEAAKVAVARLNHPDWWIDKVRAQFPEQWQAMLEVANDPPPMTLRVNLRRTTTADYLERLDSVAMSGAVLGRAALRLSQPVPVANLPGFAQGDVSVQDASAQHGATLLDLAGGMRVLDACSAPGGKTGHILELADVHLLALDSNQARLDRVAENLRRLQLQAELRLADTTDPAQWWDGRQFDRILIDAPCTGSGVVRRHPDIKWARRPSDIGQFVVQQHRLLEALWPTLRLGGKLLYATCSVFREENHEQIAAFLSRHRDAECLPLANLNTQDGQIVPDDSHDGFFYALLGKI